MANIKIEGDIWKARLGEERPRPGVRLVLFLSQPTGQRPYRVVEVPEDSFSSQGDVDKLSKKQLLELYERSTSMDVPVYRSDEIRDVRNKTDK